MDLTTRSARKRLSGRVLVFSASCALIGAALLFLTWNMRAQQSSGSKAVVRHGFVLNGRIEGSVQQLTGEATTLNGGASLTGDLLVPGTPTVRLNGNPTFGGTVQGGGGAQPSNYQITLNGNAQLGHLLTRTNPITIPNVPAPPASTGTRSVVINSAGQSPGAFSTLRDLTLNGNVGTMSVPPGTYRNFTANGGSGFALGVAGATTPAVYNLNSLTLNGGSHLQVVGPVVLTTATSVTLNAIMGTEGNSRWLDFRVASGGVTLNGGSALHAVVNAPSGTVTINGNSRLVGNVTCDRLVVNGGLIQIVQQDATAPAIIINQPAAGTFVNAANINVTGTFSDESPTTVTVNGTPASLSGNTFSAAVSLVEGNNQLLVVATDAFGNQSQATRGITRDTAPPALMVSPEATLTNAAQVAVNVTLTDASPSTVTVNGAAATPNGNVFTASVPLVEGLNTIQVSATDAAGNQNTATSYVTRDTVAPVLNLISPADGFVTDTTSIDLYGQVADATQVTITADGNPVIVNGNTFSGQISPPEGVSQIHVRATDAAGNSTEVVRSVTSDDTEPVITDITPAEGTVIAGVTATIQGRVIDATTVTVKVGNATASVSAGGLFTAANVPVAEGENEFLIKALDVAGNESEAELLLVGKDLTPPAAPSVFSVQTPTQLGFQSIEGRAEPKTKVRITGGVETAQATAAAGTGLFVVNVKLAAGTNALQVTSIDAGDNTSPAVALSITSDANLPLAPDGQPSRITVATGDTQRGLVATELPRPLIAIVRDRSGNPVSNAIVRFTVTHGGGRFTNGNASADAQTDGDGYARARYVSGNAPGVQLVRADFAGNLLAPTTFMAEALTSEPGAVTSVSGTVRDSNLRALPNVLVRLSGQETRTGADGRFRIENVPAGPHQILELIGRDQITLPGRWPNITYDMDVLPGIDNNLGRQLFLPKVNDGVAMPLDASGIVTSDTSVQLNVVGGEPPIVITARAGTRVTFPPDATDKRLSVTRILASRVPMPLEDGLASNLFISVQPSGAIFDPPLEVSFPNADELQPNTEVMLMSFDHDAGRYVRVGGGKVTADGLRVRNDPGSGIRVGAWHSLPPRPGGGGGNPQPDEITVIAQIKIKGNPDLEGVHINDILAQLGGNRAMVLTERALWHDSEELTVRGRANRSNGNAPGAAAEVHIDVDIPTEIPEVTLEEVSFKDNYAIKPDDGSEEYKDPHWQKPASPDPNYKGEPVAYKNEGGKKIKLVAKFSLAKEITEPPKPQVKADGNDPYELAPVVAKYDKKTKTLKLENGVVTTAFTADTIDYIEAMNFKWEVSFDEGKKWFDAGTSSNQMYVTLGKPDAAYHIIVHLATKNLKGLKKDAPQAIVNAVWAEFSDRAIYRAKDEQQTTKMTYWGAFCHNPATTKSDPPDCFKPKGIPVRGDARCEGWQEFFVEVLRTQGVNAVKIFVTAKPQTDFATGQAYVSGIVVRNNPVQGNAPNPPVDFNGHAIIRVKVNNVEKIYDPSYGTGPFDNLIAWENASLVEVYYQVRKDGPVIPSLTKQNQPTTEETVATVIP
jgi:cytoskeletal protein CcmA (bactofilin family)